MTQYYSVETTGIDSIPVVKASALSGYGARLKRFRATVNLAAQAAGSTFVLADIPAGHIFAGGEVTTDTSLSTATVAIGTAASASKYASAQTLTAVNAPALIGNVAQLIAAPFTANERVILTTAVASLPASGTLVVDLYFSHPN
jgi:hypothetical protein